MKVDRGNAAHWLYLVMFTCNVVCAVLLRWLRWWPVDGLVVLYGHKLNGNLAAILDQADRDAFVPELAFLTMDPQYHRELLADGKRSVLALSPSCIQLLARTQAIISDHGLHSLELMARFSSIPLFDVWHGIPFKGFDAQDFRAQHRYDETWVVSPRLKALYQDKFCFDPARVHVTGYARTDKLVNRRESLAELRNRLGLAGTGARKVVLFAPTWKQDRQGRSIFPFGVEPKTFFDALEQACHKADAVVLFRAHLNSGDVSILATDRVICVPHASFPDTEAVLLLSDVLVCDWSSIAFDFLLLDRPTIFLDVEPPFAKGFSLGPEYRFGAVVSTVPGLIARLEQALLDPEAYREEFLASHAATRSELYSIFADGHAAERCLARLRQVLVRGESSR